MNYIEYMESGTSKGGVKDSTAYVKHIPLETYGPESSLTLKRNNWPKAFYDAFIQFKNRYAKRTPVVTDDFESDNDNSLFSVGTTRLVYPSRALAATIGVAGSVLHRAFNNQSRP